MSQNIIIEQAPQNDREYRRLVQQLDNLVDEVGEDENHPLASKLEALGVLVEEYENRHVTVLA